MQHAYLGKARQLSRKEMRSREQQQGGGEEKRRDLTSSLAKELARQDIGELAVPAHGLGKIEVVGEK